MEQQASKSVYDVVVVGGGIGGLTAGALLARAGKRVLVAEQEEQAGGFACEFEHGEYKINPALHLIMGCGRASDTGQGLIDAVLDHLGTRDLCEFVSVDPFYRVLFPEFQMDIAAGREPFLESYRRAFPDEAEDFAKLVDLCSQIYQESIAFPIVPRWRDWALMPFRFPGIFRHANATLGSVLDKYLSSPRLKSAYAALWPYAGLPPSRLSFLTWAVMMTGYVEEGAFYCQGGFQRMVDALAAGLVNHGGELILGARVTRVRADGGRVQGVSLESGQEIDAPVVISNVDARGTFQDLLDGGQLPAGYLRKLEQMEPSASVLGLHLATDLDVKGLGIPKVTIVAPWDLESAYTAALEGCVGGLAVHIPTVEDASLAPPGEHVVVIQAFIPSETGAFSPAASARFAESLLEQAERVLPGLRDHITFVEGRSEDEGQAYPLQRLGPIYGWAATPRQSAARRLPNRSPVDGLFLAGHWSQPGHGIWTVVLSGIHTARLVLGKSSSKGAWPLRF